MSGGGKFKSLSSVESPLPALPISHDHLHPTKRVRGGEGGDDDASGSFSSLLKSIISSAIFQTLVFTLLVLLWFRDFYREV